ncbi:glycosyltransferase family 4 protein [Photobacterium leiognathi subsp. mandapamensis]|uniref:glycosyltransferase family 4 protein n=1 Tax=Photobacterium leiognathi TaxID=553611 RepID=UPI003AF39D92
MNILLINHYAGSPEHGMEFRPYYIAREINNTGNKCFIVAADHSHLRKITTLSGYDNIDGVDYLWLKTKKYEGNGSGRVLNIFSFLYQLYKKANEIIKWSKPDIVIASSTYPLDNYLAHYIAKKCNAKVIYEVHDLWPLSPMEIGGLSKWHPFIMLLQMAENYGLKNCHQLISMLPNTLPHMIEHGLDNSKFNYIPNGIDLSNCIIEELSEMHTLTMEKLKAKNQSIVGYAGGHAESNCLDLLIDAATLLPNVQFVLLGDGIEKARLINSVSTKGLKNVTFLPPVSKNVVQSFLSYCDILTLVWHDLPLYKFGVSPNKIFDYMLAKKPIVQALTSENDPVTLANAGITIETGNPKLLSEAYERILQLSDFERNRLGDNGYNYVINNHSYSYLSNKFIEVCKK